MAVSGGVDSMVLLDLLCRTPGLELVVAHFDHGIRPDSAEDRKLVEHEAARRGWPFVFAEGNLGAVASEAEARQARYEFLWKVQKEQGARAIITAHHQDDMLETAVLNLLRGTGRRGLSSLRSREGLARPLLGWSKPDIRRYAEERGLKWREDVTNQDERYLRNYIRRNILTRFDEKSRDLLLRLIRQTEELNEQIDQLLDEYLDAQPARSELNRLRYLQLPYAVSSEVMAAWLRRNGIRQFDRRLIDRLVVAAKTARPGKSADVNSQFIIKFTKDRIRLVPRQSSENPQK